MANKNKNVPAVKSKRVFAFLLDWYLGNVFITLPIGFLYSLKSNEGIIQTDLTKFPGNSGYLAALLGLVFAVFYYYVVPTHIWKGQTLGKKILSLKIVTEDGQEVNNKAMALRQLLGICFLEAAFVQTGEIVVEIISMLTVSIVGTVLSYLMVTIFVISGILGYKKNKPLHDLLGKTTVIDIKQK